jgi:uncharacterized membrane protein
MTRGQHWPSQCPVRLSTIKERHEVAIDTFFSYEGIYSNVDDALDDYEAVKLLHTELGLIDAYDAAVVEHKENGKVKIVKKHETPTRVGGVLGGGLGLATGLVIALFPGAAIGAGLLVGTTAGGTILGVIAGHASAGMSRSDLKDLGEALDEGQAGLVVVAVADTQAKVQAAMKRAQKVHAKELKADHKAMEQEAKAAADAP